MAQGYTKLFQEIVTSTIWQAPNNCRVLWVTMLALKDKDHICRATVPFLAKACDISVEECQGYIDQFCQPDPHSRSKNDEGRRIIQVDEGFFIINGEKYRNLLRHEERKEYVRQKVAEHRARKKDVNSEVNSGKQSNLGKPISDTDTDTEAKATQSQNPVSEPKGSSTPPETLLPTDKQEHISVDKSSSARGTRLPKGWSLPDEWLAWAASEFPSWSAAAILSRAERFRDYWHGVPGQKGRKADWEATWRNWCRRDAEQGGGTVGRTSRGDAAVQEFLSRGESVLPPPDTGGSP